MIRSLNALARRQLSADPLRTILSILAVTIGVATTIAVDVVGQAMLSGLAQSEDVQTIASGLFDNAELIFGLVGVVVTTAAAFMIFNAFLMSVTQRQQQIGALRALGMTRWQVIRLVALEALMIGGAGTALGLILGPLVGKGLLYLMESSGGLLFNAFGEAQVRAGNVALAAGLGVGITLLAVLIPAVQAAHVSPLVALRTPVDSTTSRRRPLRSIVALAVMGGLVLWLAIAPPGAWLRPPNDVRLTAITAMVWIGALALLLPGLVSMTAQLTRKPLQRYGSVTGRLVADNLGRGRGRVSLTIAALSVGLGTIIALTGITNLFMRELFGVMFEAARDQQAFGLFSFDLTEGVSSYANLDEITIPQERVAAVYEAAGEDAFVIEWYFAVVPETGFLNESYFSYVIDVTEIPYTGGWLWRFSEGDWDHAMPIMQEGCGVLIAPVIASRNGVGLYDTLTLTKPDGGRFDCIVAGIGQGNANASIISINAKDTLGVDETMAIIVQARPGMNRADLMTRLQATADRYDGLYLIDMIEFTDVQYQATDLLIQALDGMLILAILAAGLGVINTTVISVTERRRELGLLRAVGATRRQVIAVVTGETALMGLIGAVIGIVGGAGLVIIMATVYGGYGWGIVDFPHWGAAGRSLGTAVVPALLGLIAAPLIAAGAAYFPARSIVRGSAIDTMDPRRKPQPDRVNGAQLPRRIEFLAWRSIQFAPARAVLSALAVAMGVSITIASDVMIRGIISAMGESSVMSGFISNIGLFIQITGLLVSGAAAFIVYNSMTVSITQRQTEIGALRALGMTRRQVTRLIVLEAAALGIAGALLGLLIGPMVGRALLTLLETTGLEPTDTAIQPWIILGAMVSGAGLAILAGVIPARRAAHIPPIQAIRAPQATPDEEPSAPRWWIGIAFTVALMLFIVFSPPYRWMGQELPHPLFMWGLLFSLWTLAAVCFALILPGLVSILLGLARWLVLRPGGIDARLAMDKLQRGHGRVRVLALAFAIGVAIVLWTGGQVDIVNGIVTFSSERYLAEQSWIATKINPDDALAQINGMGSDEFLFLPAEIEAVRAAADGMATVSAAYQVVVPEISAPVPGFPSVITDIEHLQGPGAFTFSEGDWETATPIFEGGCGLLVSSNVAGRLSAGVGDAVQITGLNGPVDCRVAGIGSGGVLPVSFISSRAADQFVRAGQQPDTLNIHPLPGESRDEIEVALDAVSERYAGQVYIYDSEQAVEGVLSTSDQLSAAFSLMQLLAVMAAALGVANTTLQSMVERRRELGLLRAVGATRSQITRAVLIEAVITGLLGALLGIGLGTAMTLIYGFTTGGVAFGVDNYPVVERTLRAALTSQRYAAASIILAPLLAALAAYFPVRSILRGSAIETLQPERTRPIALEGAFTRLARFGDLQLRFALGTGLLMAVVLGGLVLTITAHARLRLEETTVDTLRQMVSFNARMLEITLPDDADNLDLDMTTSGSGFGFDAGSLLDLQSLMDDMTANGLIEFQITDRDDIVLMSLDQRDIGDIAPPLESPGEVAVTSERDRRAWMLTAHAPVQNAGGVIIGSVRMTVDGAPIAEFATTLRDRLLVVGGLLTLVMVLVAWGIAAPLSRAARRLSGHAADVGRGEYRLFDLPKRGRLSRWLTLRARLTLAMAALLVVVIAVLEIVTLPIERQQIEETSLKGMIALAEWMSRVSSETVGQIDETEMLRGNTPSLETLLDTTQPMDIAQLQELSEGMPREDLAYSALVDSKGQIILSDQLSLVGETAPVSRITQVDEGIFRGEPVWVIASPLYREDELIGSLRIAIWQARADEFMAEARNLFRLTGIIAVLAGILLAQVIGGAISAPVREMEAGTRRIAEGDLAVRFNVDGRDELGRLAQAYNEMVIGLQEREWLREMFGRFVSQEVADAISSGQIRLEGENLVVSVLFSDIRGFTSLSEKYAPQEVMALLNAYLPYVVDAAHAYGGTVNKFGGDSTLIVYGAPRPMQDSAYHAVQTALLMRESLARFNETLRIRGIEPLSIGIGINTGEVLAGALGSHDRQEYTVIGDAVNLASRIEALNKQYPEHDILISAWTYEALGPRRDEFDLVNLGEIGIRGKQQPVSIWAVMGMTAVGSPRPRRAE